MDEKQSLLSVAVTDIRQATARASLPLPTDYPPLLIQYAKDGLKRIFKPGLNYKKTGILLAGLVPRSSYQPDLFVPQGRSQDQQEAIISLMEAVNRRHGMAAASLNLQQKGSQRMSSRGNPGSGRVPTAIRLAGMSY